MNLPIFVTYEDRAKALDGVKLLALSLDRVAPGAKFVLHTNLPSTGIIEWAKNSLNSLVFDVVSYHDEKFSGWSVKPDILIKSLESFGGPVCWLDSDLLAIADFSSLFSELAEEDLLICTQRGAFDALKTTLWDDPVGKPLPYAVNSCILRVTHYHLKLLENWRERLLAEQYVNEQRKPWYERIAQLYGDQDVLEGLLNAELPDVLNNIKVRYIFSGKQILHEGDQGWFQRLFINPKGLMFVHAQGSKPWNHDQARGLRKLRIELCPYTHFAREYAEYLGNDTPPEWIVEKNFSAKVCMVLSVNHPIMKAIPAMLLQNISQLVEVRASNYRSKEPNSSNN